MHYRPLFGNSAPHIGEIEGPPAPGVGPAPIGFPEDIWEIISRSFFENFGAVLSNVWGQIDASTMGQINAVLNQAVFTNEAKAEEISSILNNFGADMIDGEDQQLPDVIEGPPENTDAGIIAPAEFANQGLASVWGILTQSALLQGSPILVQNFANLPANHKALVLEYAGQFANTGDDEYLDAALEVLTGFGIEGEDSGIFTEESLLVGEDDVADVDSSWGNLFGDTFGEVESGLADLRDSFTEGFEDVVSTSSQVLQNVNAALASQFPFQDLQNHDISHTLLSAVTQIANDVRVLSAEEIAKAIYRFKSLDFPRYSSDELVEILYFIAIKDESVLDEEQVNVLTDDSREDALCSAANKSLVRRVFGDNSGNAFDIFCSLSPAARVDQFNLDSKNLAQVMSVSGDSFDQFVLNSLDQSLSIPVPPGSDFSDIQDAFGEQIGAALDAAEKKAQAGSITQGLVHGAVIGGAILGLVTLVRKVREG
jgi:hypothetical protein